MALLAIVTLAGPAVADSIHQEFSDFVTPLPVQPGETLVLGIVGGWERWDNPVRCVRRTAIVVKRQRLLGVHVETVNNHQLSLAEELVRRAFDFNSDGTLSPAEAAQARVIVFGQSLGGRATLRFCRWLKERGIQVPLAVVVDSIGPDSYLVPSNVAAAANFYQRDHILLKGAPLIQAEDPAKTRILGNWRFTYRDHKVDASDDIAAHRLFMGGHTYLEFDPRAWSRIEELVTSAAAEHDGSSRPARPAP